MAHAIQPVAQPTITEQNRIHAADTARIARLGTPPTMGKNNGGVPLSESFLASLHTLSANVTRTVLTMLGIIIGVASVIALLAYGNGVVAKAVATLERNGTNLITVQGANQRSAGVATGSLSNTLTLEDAQALAQPGTIPDAAAISPELGRGGRMNVGTVNTFGETVGVWPGYQDVHSYATVSGTLISDQDVTSNALVIALGANIATTLFPGSDPVGKTVRLNNLAFQVVGVMEAKGGTSRGSLDNQVYVPITAVLTLLTGNRQQPTGAGHTIDTIAVKASSPGSVDTAISEINDALAAQHRTKNGQPD